MALGQESGVETIRGIVEDPTTAAMAGASVTLLSLNRVLPTESGADGAFRFDSQEPGDYAIEITAPGLVRKTLPITLQAGHAQDPIVVVLKMGSVPDMEKCGRDVSVRYEGLDASGVNLTGTLRDYFARQAIALAEVRIVSEANRQPVVVVRSDRAGRFAVSQLAPDYYGIQILRKGYWREEFKHVLIPRENKVVLESTLRTRTQMARCQ